MTTPTKKCPDCNIGTHTETTTCLICKGSGRYSKTIHRKCRCCDDGVFKTKGGKKVKCLRCKGTGNYTFNTEPVKCNACNGRGTKFIRVCCKTCNGTSELSLNPLGAFWPLQEIAIG